MMKKISGLLLALLILLVTGTAFADRGQIRPYPVRLAETSQKAIILHNRDEEVLILGTELQSEKEMGVLEFIPFPAEPEVSLAKGDPFGTLQKLIARKKLEFIGKTKGGGGAAAPVEITFKAQMGLHDVTIVKINDPEAFKQWVVKFFKGKGISVNDNLDAVERNAEDYMQRGFHYFVFDYVYLRKEVKSFEPLVYRFQSKRLYYPLKTSNVVGGEGGVDLAFIIPGSLGLLIDRSDLQQFREPFAGIGQWKLSSSAKAYPDELKAIYPKAGEFFKDAKIYLQVFHYNGDYKFGGDLSLDITNIAPYAYKNIIYRPDYNNYPNGGSYELAEAFTPDEKKDIVEAYAQKRPEWAFEPEYMEAIRDLDNQEEGIK